jgi:hypothetical protein
MIIKKRVFEKILCFEEHFTKWWKFGTQKNAG